MSAHRRNNPKKEALFFSTIIALFLLIGITNASYSQDLSPNQVVDAETPEPNYWQIRFDAFQHQPNGIVEIEDLGLWIYGGLDDGIFSMAVDAQGRQKSFDKHTLSGHRVSQIGAAGTVVEDGYVLGVTVTALEGDSIPKGWLLKLNTDGTVQESLVLDAPVTFEVRALATGQDGNIIVVGRKDYSLWIAKANPDLDLIWEKTYISPSYNGPEGPNYGFSVHDVIEADDQGIVVLSDFTNPQIDADSSTAWILKTNKDGNLDESSATWEKLLGYENDSDKRISVSSIIASNDGGFVIAGANSEYASRPYQAWLAKLSPNGTFVWQNVYGFIPTSTLSDSGTWDVEAVDDGYLITGAKSGTAAFINKIDEDGAVVWSRHASYYYKGNLHLETMSDDSIGYVAKHSSVLASETYLKVMKFNSTIDRPACIDFTEDELPEIRATNTTELNRQQNIEGIITNSSGQSTQNITSQSTPLILEWTCAEEELKILGPQEGTLLLENETLTVYTNLEEVEDQTGVGIVQAQLEAYFDGRWQAVGSATTNAPFDLEITVLPESVDPVTNKIKLRLRMLLTNGAVYYTNPQNVVEYPISDESGVNLNVRYADQVYIQGSKERGFWNWCGPTSTAMMLHYLDEINGDILHDPALTEALTDTVLFTNSEGYRLSSGKTINDTLSNAGVIAESISSNKITFELIKTSIDRGYPVVLSLNDNPKPEHIVLVTGYFGTESIIVNDPFGDYDWWVKVNNGTCDGCLNNLPNNGNSASPMFRGYHVNYTFSENFDKDVAGLYAVFAVDALPEPPSATSILEEGVTNIRTDYVDVAIQAVSSRGTVEYGPTSISFTLAETYSPSAGSPEHATHLIPFSISSSVAGSELPELKIDLSVDVDPNIIDTWHDVYGFSTASITIENQNRLFLARLNPSSGQWEERSAVINFEQGQLQASVSEIGEYAVFIESTSMVVTEPDVRNSTFIPMIQNGPR